MRRRYHCGNLAIVRLGDTLRLLGAAATLMEKPDKEISKEEGRLLKMLSILIDEYENRAHPLPKAVPHRP